MAHKEVKTVLTESTVPCKQLVEGVALGTSLVLAEQSTGRCLIAMFVVHVVRIVTVVVVETEVQGKLYALEPSETVLVATKDKAATHAGNVTQGLGFVEHKHSQ